METRLRRTIPVGGRCGRCQGLRGRLYLCFLSSCIAASDILPESCIFNNISTSDRFSPNWIYISFSVFFFVSFFAHTRTITLQNVGTSFWELYFHIIVAIVWTIFEMTVDCSQSPMFSWDRLDIPRLTVTGILIFKGTEGAGVSSRWGDRVETRNRPSRHPNRL